MKNILLSILLISSISCGINYKTMNFGNITLQVPSGMKRQDILIDSTIIERNLIYDSFIYKDNNAAYSIVYSKYKDEYTNLYNLYNASKSALNNMKNNPSFKELKVITSEEVLISGTKGVITTVEFIYGIHRTRAKSLILIDNSMFHLISIYTKKHKASENTIDTMIKSIKINR